MPAHEAITIEGLSNRDFFEQYAGAGRIGVVGGADWANRLIRRAQRRQDPKKRWSDWSHAFIFQGRRRDGYHWILESDIAIRTKHLRLGAQENRIAKYYDDAMYPSVTVIDLGLDEAKQQELIALALEYVATGAKYSLRELVGTAIALKNPAWRSRENLLARKQAFYCSAFVRHLFSRIGFELADGIAVKNTTPEDIFRIALPHRRWVMRR